MSVAAAFARLKELLFVGEDRPPDQAAGPRSIVAWIGLFAVTRLATLLMFRLRHLPRLMSDSLNYVVLARFIQANGHLPHVGFSAHQFPGLSFLMVAVDPIFHNLEISGYVVAWGGSIASIALFHAMFRSDRLTAIYTIFVPSWIASSSLILTEGCTFLLLLVAMKALETESRRRQLLLLVIAGYALVLRNTAVLFLLPLVVVWSAGRPAASPGAVALRVLALGLPCLAYLTFNYATIGMLFPQVASAQQYLVARAGTYYPPSLMTWPGHSLLLGLVRSSENPLKRLSVLASLVLAGLACRELWRASEDGAGAGVLRDPRMARALAAGVFAHTLFHLCVGGSFGYSSFERYVSHVNPPLVIGLFGRRRLRWGWIGALAVVGVAFAGLTGNLPEPGAPIARP